MHLFECTIVFSTQFLPIVHISTIVLSCKNRSINAFKRHLPVTQKKPCVLMHTMLSTSITDSSEVPAPPHPAPIVAKTNVSALLPAATSNSVSGPSAILISVHDASLAHLASIFDIGCPEFEARSARGKHMRQTQPQVAPS